MTSLDVTPEPRPTKPPATRGSALAVDEINRSLLELAQRLETAQGLDDFLPVFLEQAVTLTRGTAAVLWSTGPAGCQLLRQHQLETTGLREGTPVWLSHTLTVQDAAVRTQAIWMPPRPADPDSTAPARRLNLTPFALVLAPVVVDNQVVAVLEIFLSPERREGRRFLAQLATQLAGFVAAAFHKDQRRDLMDQQQVWRDLEAFAQRVHRSLKLKEVAYIAANDGKKLLTCDQVAVGISHGGRWQVEAVSGAVRVDQRSPLVRAMRQLLEAVGNWGEPLSFAGSRDSAWPAAVARALDQYLALSNSSRLVVLPLRSESGDAPACGALLAEYFAPDAAASRLTERLTLVGKHVTPALANALAFERLPLKWLTLPLACVRDGAAGKARARFLVAAAAVAALSALLTLVRVPLRLEATGQLAPQERRIVYAPLSGRIVQLLAQQGDRIDKGQELLFIADPETQLKVNKLTIAISAAKQKLAFLDEQLARPLGARDRAEFVSERIKTQYEQQKAVVERDLLLAECRTPQKAPVVAPVAGQLLTFDAREKLLGKEVKLGDALLRVAATDGPWEVELFLPEREAGAIRAALAADDGQLPVDLLLSSDPQRTYAGKLCLHDLGGETIVRDNKVVLPVRVEITDRALLTQLERMPVGVEVRAKINCGHASLGYVWFGEIWEFIYERFLF